MNYKFSFNKRCKGGYIYWNMRLASTDACLEISICASLYEPRRVSAVRLREARLWLKQNILLTKGEQQC